MKSKGSGTRVMQLEPFLIHQKVTMVVTLPNQLAAATYLPAQQLDLLPIVTDKIWLVE